MDEYVEDTPEQAIIRNELKQLMSRALGGMVHYFGVTQTVWALRNVCDGLEKDQDMRIAQEMESWAM